MDKDIEKSWGKNGKKILGAQLPYACKTTVNKQKYIFL